MRGREHRGTERRGPGADVLLGRALAASARAAGARIDIAASATEPWHSATFTGARHAIEVEADAGAALERWLDRLEPCAITLPGHLLADVAVTRATSTECRVRLRVAALTVAGG